MFSSLLQKGILYSFFFCVAGISSAQSDFRFRNYTINDGLSQSSVTTILQDDLNALWIGTQDGLNRFDGKTFEIFISDETDGLENEFIICSVKDQKGDLWFGTGKGLVHYNLHTEQFKTYKTSDGVGLHIISIAQDSKGSLWISTAESGLFKFSTKTKVFRDMSSLVPSKRLSQIAITQKGSLIVSTENDGVYLCNTYQQTVEKLLLPGGGIPIVVNKIITDGSENVLLATSQGIFEVNTRTKYVAPKFAFLNSQKGIQNVSDIHEENGVGWLITTKGNGLFLIDGEGAILHSTEDMFQKSALLFNEINLIYKDNAGTFWLGSQRGLSSFNPIARGILGVGPTANSSKGIPSPSVWSFTEDQTGNLVYIGTDKTVSRLERKTKKFIQYERTEVKESQTKGEMAVLCMKLVTPNKMLVGCADGFFILNMNGTSYSYTPIETSDGQTERVYSIVHWKDELYWLATKNGALLYNDKTREVKAFTHSPTNPGKTISKGICRLVQKDNQGNIWFATSAGGLNILTEKDGIIRIEPFKKNKLLRTATSDYIASIYQESTGVYWLGTAGSGLVRLDVKIDSVRTFTKSNGLPNNVIYSVVADEKGNLWLSTNKGISNVNPKTLEVTNYTESDGLMSNEFNLGAAMKSITGTLYFGGIYGYNYFKPREVLRTQREVDVVFTKFKLENDWLTPNDKNSPLKKPIFLTEELELGYMQRSFTLKFQSSDLSSPDQINYKYILEGSDGGDVLIGTTNEIRFISLSPGTYTLKIYARLGTGKWGKYPATMKLIIASPFWLRWWFFVLVGVGVLVAFRLVVIRRTESSRREQIRLEMKVRDRTREIQNQKRKIEQQNKKIEEEKNNVIRQQVLLQIEKDKTEKLLKNVMPESTAEELKKSGKARARGYKVVSVLFTDFVGFTKISDRMKPSELVKKLDVYFTKFDEIIVKNNLEKIKTIGDAYMCAGGVPVRNNTNPIDTCLAGLQIQDYIQKRKNDALANGGDYWELRLGINTGEVTAGVIGSERLAFDIWGTTVNQAQRMEMLGAPGKVTITGATFSHIEPYFECTFLGKAQTKSSGMVEMYVVDRIKPELSINGDGLEPNERFHQIVNLHHYSSINYYKAERHINKTLEQGLSDKLYYHSIGHSKDVVKAVERLALLENVTDEGLFLLKSAASYHDAGFVESYEHNEKIGAQMAQEVLPKFGYTQKHIDQIKELIYVTEIPHKPKNKLEEIICDADLDYLGRDDFHEIADRLKQELKDHGKIQSDRQWDEIQVKFLESHRYFTKTAQETRNAKKAQHLNEIKERLKRNQYTD